MLCPCVMVGNVFLEDCVFRYTGEFNRISSNLSQNILELAHKLRKGEVQLSFTTCGVTPHFSPSNPKRTRVRTVVGNNTFPPSTYPIPSQPDCISDAREVMSANWFCSSVSTLVASSDASRCLQTCSMGV